MTCPLITCLLSYSPSQGRRPVEGDEGHEVCQTGDLTEGGEGHEEVNSQICAGQMARGVLGPIKGLGVSAAISNARAREKGKCIAFSSVIIMT